MHTALAKKFHKFTFYIFISLLHLPFVFAKKPVFNSASQKNIKEMPAVTPVSENETTIYDSLKLNTLGLSRQAFDYGMKGYNYLLLAGKLKNENIISIVDFSLESAKKRLFVLDLKNYKVLFNTYVAHGKNSGKDVASQFSNAVESNKSSLGFYVTDDTYNGSHGYSLRLDGLDKGFNDNALDRAIVMHSAWYVNENIIKSKGCIGRSQGCPALPEKLTVPIIQTIKNGSCLFLYSPNKYYISHSQILMQPNAA